MTEELQNKIRQSIKLLQTTCGGKDNVELAYSGGKDSDVILQLAKEAGIKFTPRYKNTTIDPPGTIKHCKDNGVEILQPKESFFEIVKKAGYPNRFHRLCCARLKEYPTESDTVIVGIRRDESKSRKKRYLEPTICRVYSKKKRVQQILPILYWTQDDVRMFIEDRNIKCHPIYYDENGFFHAERRLGCEGCPLMSQKKRVEFFKDNPRWLKAWVRAGHDFYHQRSLNEYEMMVGMLFYKSIRELNEIQNGLFGKMDCKRLLEERFGIKL